MEMMTIAWLKAWGLLTSAKMGWIPGWGSKTPHTTWQPCLPRSHGLCTQELACLNGKDPV